jgi:probable HAF family extracellular repeat protein
MKSRTFSTSSALITIVCLVLSFGLSAQTSSRESHTHYLVVELGTLGGTASGANAINDRGWAMGLANLPGDATAHATVWIYGKTYDLGTLGGPNSAVGWPAVKNNHGVIVGVSDTADDNPLHEVWSCALAFFPTPSGKNCRGFVWKDGKMRALPTLGGYNGVATGVNNRGQIVGWAETTYHDPTCTSPQVLQFLGVIYGPGKDQVQALPPYGDDQDSAATAINDKGQVVGISGQCSNAVGGLSAHHAVLWENGVATDIGNFGGIAWNTPTAINNRGQVVGFSDFPGDSATLRNYHAFVWTKNGGMQDLKTLPGDTRSIAWGINDRGQIVGQSSGGPNGSHAVIWENGVPVDLNSRVPAGSPTLVYANDIDDSGEIVGGAFDAKTGNSPGFAAIPIFGIDDGSHDDLEH